MQVREEWLKNYTLTNDIAKLNTIEEIDSLAGQIKRATTEDVKMEKKITKMLMGKDKIRIDKLWS